jgi:putative SOS response-associated peptidase YedK
MCGRFALAIPRRRVAEAMGLDNMPEAPARYNIAPSQPVEAVRADQDTGHRVAGIYHWGLVPFWAKDPKIGYKMINARSETVFDKPSFRAAIHSHRCLIPAQGFYEWQHAGSAKAPFFITQTNADVMALAGIYEYWNGPDDQVIDSVAILTREAVGVVSQLHDRMPVILEPKAFTAWLDPATTDRNDIEELLALPAPDLAAVPVGILVNSPKHDGPELIIPIGPPLSVE